MSTPEEIARQLAADNEALRTALKNAETDLGSLERQNARLRARVPTRLTRAGRAAGWTVFGATLAEYGGAIWSALTSPSQPGNKAGSSGSSAPAPADTKGLVSTARAHRTDQPFTAALDRALSQANVTDTMTMQALQSSELGRDSPDFFRAVHNISAPFNRALVQGGISGAGGATATVAAVLGPENARYTVIDLSRFPRANPPGSFRFERVSPGSSQPTLVAGVQDMGNGIYMLRETGTAQSSVIRVTGASGPVVSIPMAGALNGGNRERFFSTLQANRAVAETPAPGVAPRGLAP
jgi:hypothetical protein